MAVRDATPAAPPAMADSIWDEAPSEGSLRSGLAMASANAGASGILSAWELSSFDWRGTELVVLSACATGLGNAAPGDGMYGLTRALAMAGVASQIVSLWAVDDEATFRLMRELYRGLSTGIGRAESLRRAKRKLLEDKALAHPFYWAAFVLAGDWRPLHKNTLRAGR